MILFRFKYFKTPSIIFIALFSSININNDKQFKQTAFRYYDNPSCVSFEQFENDLRVFNTTAIVFERYCSDPSKVPERLLLNRIIITHNMFGRFTYAGLFWKTNQRYWTQLKTCLVFLQLLPDDIKFNDVDTDKHLMEILENL